MHYVPIAFITAQTGKNVKALLNPAQMLYKQSRQRVTTGRLNRVVRNALERNPPPLPQESPAARSITARRWSVPATDDRTCFAASRRPCPRRIAAIC